MSAHANAVVFATDATYLPIAWTAAKTAAAQPGRNFDVLLLTAPGLTRRVPPPPGCQMREVELPAALRGLPHPAHMSPFANVRLAIADIWARGYERLLYLDSDTRITGPLAPLFGLDLQGNTIAMVQDCGRYLRDAAAKPDWDKYRASLGSDPTAPYYNAGVLLIDTARWHTQNCWQRLQDFITAREGNLIFMDQDALNVVCAGRIAELSPRWNFQTHYFGLGLEAVVQPRILHYLNILKPWRDPEWAEMYGGEAPRAFAGLLADSPWPRLMHPGLTRAGRWRRWGALRAARHTRRVPDEAVKRYLCHFTAIAERLRREIPVGLAAAPRCVDLSPDESRAWQAAISPA